MSGSLKRDTVTRFDLYIALRIKIRASWNLAAMRGEEMGSDVFSDAESAADRPQRASGNLEENNDHLSVAHYFPKSICHAPDTTPETTQLHDLTVIDE